MTKIIPLPMPPHKNRCSFCCKTGHLDGPGGCLVPVGRPFFVHQSCLMERYGAVVAQCPPELLRRYGLVRRRAAR